MPRDVGLALGGGGARGLAHIGVVAELERAGYRVAAVAGTSIGGVMAAAYASGRTTDEIASWAALLFSDRLFHFHPSDDALMSIERIQEALTELLGEATFDRTRCPCVLTAVDLERGEEVILDSGRLLDAALATVALPGLFPPHSAGGDRLVDGGVVDPVPVRLVRARFRGPIVASVLSARPGAPPSASPLPFPIPPGAHVLARLGLVGALGVFARSLEISSRLFTELRLQLDRPEVIVRPEVAAIGILDTPEAGPVIEAGRQAMAARLNELDRWYGVRGALRRLGAGESRSPR
jgi:NTE family protein